MLINSTADEMSMIPKRFVLNVKTILEQLKDQEDTDKNLQITIEESGPKVSSKRRQPQLYAYPICRLFFHAQRGQRGRLCLSQKMRFTYRAGNDDFAMSPWSRTSVRQPRVVRTPTYIVSSVIKHITRSPRAETDTQIPSQHRQVQWQSRAGTELLLIRT